MEIRNNFYFEDIEMKEAKSINENPIINENNEEN